MDEWREYVVTDLARDVKDQLAGDATFDGRPLRAGDVAVLAFKRRTLQAVQAALRELGVASVIGAGGSVFHTGAATEWLRVPLGPFTVTSRSSIDTSTPDGTVMGSLPMRDIVLLSSWSRRYQT